MTNDSQIAANAEITWPNNWLQSFRRNVTSQTGEDGVIEKIFEVLPAGNRWCVEFGAMDGLRLSNTHSLINQHGWFSVQIEFNRKSFESLQERYRDNPRVICLNRLVNVDGADTLDNILRNTPVPADFAFLSIDVDGNDYHIWKAFEAYRPRVVVIEFNPSIHNHIDFVQPRDMSVQQGSSLLSTVTLGKEKGYELVAVTGVNAIFVDRCYFPLFGISDNSIDTLSPNRSALTYLFQLYDGTLVTQGCNRLIWHGVDFDLERIQVLPKALRRSHWRAPQ